MNSTNDPPQFDLSPQERAEIEAVSNNGHDGRPADLETRQLISAEKTVLGTLLLINSDVNLPVALAQILRNSPEAFSDRRNKQVSSAIRSLRESAKPVYPQAVIDRCEFDEADLYVTDLTKSALSLDLANKEAEPVWQAYRERRTASVLSEAFETVANAPAMARSVAVNVRKALTQLEDESVKDDLPEIEDAAALLPFEPVLPPLLIDGLIHQGHKLSLGGSSKAFKSWTLINMAASLATGTDFIGMKTTRCRVLYINFEIDSRFMHSRTNTLLTSRLLFPDPGWFEVWNLRGKSAPYSVIVPKIIRRARDRGYGMVIIDPSYKLFDAGADENSAVDVANVMNAFDAITTQTGATVAFGAHFAKGNASQKEAIDRVSGSGVFARDPDTVLTFTKHQEEDCFTVESKARNLPPMTSFVVKWIYPRFERQDDLDPAKLKQAGGRPSEFSADDLIQFLKTAPMTTTEWKRIAREEMGIGSTRFYELRKELQASNRIFKMPSSSRWTSSVQDKD